MKPKGPKALLEAEDNWETSVGKWFPGERTVYRGKDLFHDLQNLNWMQLFLYGITGRLFSDKQAILFDGMWKISTSYPDPLLWNNRVASLAGTARSSDKLALGAALAVSEASIYGGRPNIKSISFLLRAKAMLDNGVSLGSIIEEELKNSRTIFGYGRPIANRKDERIQPMLALATQLGLADGPYTKLAFDVERYLLQGRWRMHMNVTGLCAGLSADQGLSAREHFVFTGPCFTAGIIPCFLEASERPEGTFLPLSCTRIAYSGPEPRPWNPDVSQKDADN